jgi:DNA-directed RNA polymerase subunit RPC12/RpoP
MGHKYECICGNKFETALDTSRCPKCEKETLKKIKQKNILSLKKEDLPQSKKFIPIYYNDQLWYYRRSPKNTKKAIIKSLAKQFNGKKSWGDMGI